MSAHNLFRRQIESSILLPTIMMGVLLSIACVWAIIQSGGTSRALRDLPEMILVECWDYRLEDGSVVARTPKNWASAFSLESKGDEKFYLKTTVATQGRCVLKTLDFRGDNVYYNLAPTSGGARWNVCIYRPHGTVGGMTGRWVYSINTNGSEYSIWADLAEGGTGRWGYGEFDAIRAGEQELSENSMPCTWSTTPSNNGLLVSLSSRDGYLQVTVTNSDSVVE